MQKLLERRSFTALLAVAIALVSGFLLCVTLRNAYWDYWILPRDSAADGYSTYPELRYWFFDAVLLVWCVDGLIASALSLCSVFFSRAIAVWAYRALILYFVLLLVLILGGSLMLYVRSRGF
jgi:uncharacterized membrane protein